MGGAGGEQALSADNVRGIVLALISSGFIGGSFIIKKKGLRRAAAASGIGAGPSVASSGASYRHAISFLFFSFLFFRVYNPQKNDISSLCRGWWALLPPGAPMVGWHDHQ
jgi:hypothetical protein